MCEKCPENTFITEQSDECLPCITNSSSSAGSSTCTCDTGYFKADNTSCKPCDDTLCEKTALETCPCNNYVEKDVYDNYKVDVKKAVETSTSLSYLGAVLTTVLLMLGYKQRRVVQQCITGRCKVTVNTEEDGITVQFSELQQEGCQVAEGEGCHGEGCQEKGDECACSCSTECSSNCNNDFAIATLQVQDIDY